MQIAGAAAAAGLSLDKVKAEVEAVASSVGSMGMATQICSVPGNEPARGYAASYLAVAKVASLKPSSKLCAAHVAAQRS